MNTYTVPITLEISGKDIHDVLIYMNKMLARNSNIISYSQKEPIEWVRGSP